MANVPSTILVLRSLLQPSDHGFIKSIYFRDPFGYVIELAAAVGGDSPKPGAHAKLSDWQSRSPTSRDELTQPELISFAFKDQPEQKLASPIRYFLFFGLQTAPEV